VVKFLVVLGLLILPTQAALRIGYDLRWVAAYALGLSCLTYFVYALDKWKARNGEWRIPEAWLRLLDLLGGWPGGFLAQRHLRHKCSKTSFQIAFWLTVLLWQFAAFDSLQNWAFTKAAQTWVQEARLGG
jgi:uncharacterized membrane protein YsdA (DUF1294 family)